MLQHEFKGPLEEDAVRILHSAEDKRDVKREEDVSGSWLWFWDFSESRVGPRQWGKSFLFPPHLSLSQLSNSFFLCFLAFINTSINFCFISIFFIFMNQSPCQEKMNHKWKWSFFQEHNFVALCASIFVDIQKVWFSLDGVFLRDIFFF